MNFKIPGNFAQVKTLDDLVKIVSDGFKTIENNQGPSHAVVQSPTDKYPSNPNRGDTVTDMTSQPYQTKVWNGLTWVPTSGSTSTSTSTSTDSGELIVADGVDNPPEIVYNDDGGDYIYSD